MNDSDNLGPVFMPALSTLLLKAEDDKGCPLTNEEVINIRDNAVVIMMDAEATENMAKSRDYEDIDPENCWYDWQMLRRELNREPELDAGVRYAYVDHDDDEYQQTIVAAQASLGEFRKMILDKNSEEFFPLVKVLLAEPDFESYLWLQVVDIQDTEYDAEIFELPTDYKEYVVGDVVQVADADIQDWMINDKGLLYGGFSIRFSRKNMSESEQTAFDEHIGVTQYI